VNKQRENASWRKMLRLLPFVKPQMIWLILNMVFSTSRALFSFGNTLVLQQLTDAVVRANTGAFVKWLYIAGAIVVAGMMIHYGVRYASGRYITQTLRDLRAQISEHIQRLPMSTIEAHHTGDLVSRLNTDVSKIPDLLNSIPDAVYQPVLFIGSFIYLLLISWKLLLISCILIPITAVLYNKASKPMEELSRKNLEGHSRANSMIQDVIAGIPIVKAFNLQTVMFGRYSNVVSEIETQDLAMDRREAVLLTLFLALRYIPQLVCPLYGGYLALKGEITPGSVVAANMLIWNVFQPVEALLGLLRKVRTITPAIDRIFEILDEAPEHKGEPIVVSGQKRPPVELNELSFSYDGKTNILNQLSLTLTAGKVIALVGPSGSGKSTILKLICGFYEPTAGDIQLYGQDLAASDIVSARQYMSLVSQETYLFPTTIAENIGYGRPGAEQDDIVSAAQQANAHDFIMEFPEAYNTDIGEWGNRLSGGQRQRIALARAILKDAPILLLDEPTSALDTQSETLVQTALDRFMRDRTVLVVAHRLSTIHNADEILVLDQGCVQEHGTHDELMKTGSLYKNLYLNQIVSSEGNVKQSTKQEVTHD